MKVFNQANTSFITSKIVEHFVGTWSFGIMMIYAYFVHHQFGLLIMAALLIFFPSGYKYLYYRKQMFQYNKDTTFTIDSENGIFTYRHGDEVISFKSSEVEKWQWNYYYGPFTIWNGGFVEIVVFRLKDGQKITISSGIGTYDLIHYLLPNYRVLGLPEGTKLYDFDLGAYVGEISD